MRSASEVLIADIASPRSTRNISHSSRVCVAAIDVFEQRGVQIFGAADIVRPGESQWDELSAPLVALAGRSFPLRSVIRVKVERAKKILAPSLWMYPDRDAAERRAAVLERYGVQDR